MAQQRDRVLADLAALQAQEDAFVAKHEEEMNVALGAYWNMRRQTGTLIFTSFSLSRSHDRPMGDLVMSVIVPCITQRDTRHGP